MRKLTRKASMYALLTLISLVFIGPFLIMASMALKPASQPVFSFPPDLIPRPPVLTWVKEAWTAVPYPRFMLNSLLYCGVGIPIYLLVSALTAYPLGVMTFRGRTLVFFLLLSTMFLPGELMLIPRFLVVSELGLADSYLGVILPEIGRAHV